MVRAALPCADTRRRLSRCRTGDSRRCPGQSAVHVSEPVYCAALFTQWQAPRAGCGRHGAVAGIARVADTGVGGFESTQWYALFAPANTPQPVLLRLNHALNDGLANFPTVGIFETLRGFLFALRKKTPACSSRLAAIVSRHATAHRADRRAKAKFSAVAGATNEAAAIAPGNG